MQKAAQSLIEKVRAVSARRHDARDQRRGFGWHWGRHLAVLLALAAWAGCGERRDIRSLTILHANDLHARLTPDEDGRGGFAYLAAAIRRERESSPGALVLHGGDLVQGTPVSSIFEGLPVIEVANRMGFDASVLGNHEFSYGWERTAQFIQWSHFDMLCANVANPQGELIAPPYAIYEVNGVRVGVIGLITEKLSAVTRADLRGEWRATPLIETARKYATELGDRTDLLVILAHCLDEEEDRMLAELPEIPVIVGGLSHGGQDEVKEYRGRLCVKVRAYGRELGRLDLEYDTTNKRIVAHDWRRIAILAGEIEPEPRTAKAVGHWERKVSEQVDVPVGKCSRDIGRPELRAIVEQIMREAVNADLVYMNPGGIRDVLHEGIVLRRHIWNILPYGSEIAFGRLNPADLPHELQEAAEAMPRSSYIVATNDFMAEKWAERGIVLPRRGPRVRDLLIDWVAEKGVVP